MRWDKESEMEGPTRIWLGSGRVLKVSNIDVATIHTPLTREGGKVYMKGWGGWN
jgi:hypothetical protein